MCVHIYYTVTLPPFSWRLVSNTCAFYNFVVNQIFNSGTGCWVNNSCNCLYIRLLALFGVSLDGYG